MAKKQRMAKRAGSGSRRDHVAAGPGCGVGFVLCENGLKRFVRDRRSAARRRTYAMEFLSFVLDFVLHIDRHLFELVAQYGLWVYAILFVIVFCETGLVVTPFLPGDSLLFASGVVAGAGLLGYPEVMGVLLAAGIAGDAVNYGIGRHVGPAIFKKDTRFIKKEHLLKAHQFYERHGGKAIVLARFIPIVRTFAPFVAGIALMHPTTFLLYNITGCIVWVGGLVSAGYFLGNTPFARDNFGLIVYAIIIISVAPVAIELFRGWWKGRKSRAA